MSDLPENWVFTTLGKVCAKPQYGWTSKAAQKGAIKYLRTTDLSSGVVDWETVPYCLDEPDDIEKYQVEDNDIVISRAGSVGLSYRIENPPPKSVFASYLIRMRATAVEHKYLEYFLKSAEYWQQISDVSAGIAVQNINATKLSDLEIPLAPRPEQKRIVAKLDSLFGHLDQLKSRLSTIPVLLKQFRQAVLTQAVTGKLTEEWREKNKKLPQWLDTSLAEVCFVNPGHRGVEIDLNDNVSFLPMTRIQEENGVLDLSQTKKYKEVKQGFTKFIEGDVLFAKITPCMENGKIAIAKGLTGGIGCGTTELHVLRPKPEVLAEYIFYFLLRPEFRDYCKSRFKGTSGHMRVPVDVFSEFDLSLPPFAEQKEIIRRVESLFAVADRIEASYNTLQEKIDHLPQAILAKAFRGELVEQDVLNEVSHYTQETEKLSMAAEP
ncbi:MAG: restriction endonuclease subunit S [Cytophagales bacterium]|nr:restriction endonuclease subunit S [Cytophagales bacterium]